MRKSIDSIDDLHNLLRPIPWHLAGAIGHAANVLADIGPNRLRDIYERTMLEEEGHVHDQILLLSRRKSTHTKYYFGGGLPDSRDQPVVWAHDYGQPLCTSATYINKFHDHRGDFTSMQIGEADDGYTEDRLSSPDTKHERLTDTGFWIPKEQEWENVQTKTYRRGDISIMRGVWDIHRVREMGQAVTLLIHAPRLRSESQVFNDDGTPDAIYPDNNVQYSGSLERIRKNQRRNIIPEILQ